LGQGATLLLALHPSDVKHLLPGLVLVLALAACGDRPNAQIEAVAASSCASATTCAGAACPKPPSAEPEICEIADP